MITLMEEANETLRYYMRESAGKTKTSPGVMDVADASRLYELSVARARERFNKQTTQENDEPENGDS